MTATDETPVQESKTRQRVTQGQLAVSRAAKHCALYPGAQATPLIRDMQTALSGLIEEILRR